MSDGHSQLNFFRAFRFEFQDQDRVIINLCETKNTEKHEKVIPVDFSLSGLAIISRVKFEIGADITIKINFKKTKYEIFGTIVRGHLSRENDCYNFGLQFQDQSQADVLSLMDKYLISLSGKRLKENLLSALKTSSGRFRQKPHLDDMLIYLLNTFHLQGGAEDIVHDALEYTKKRGILDNEFHTKVSCPAENKYSARLSDLFDRPRFDIFSETQQITCQLIELIKVLFSTEHQRFVGFSDPKKSREYALVGESSTITDFRSNLTEILSAPSIIIFRGSKGTGKTHFSNVIREELRKKNHRSFLMNPLTELGAYREILSKEDREGHVLILDNLEELKDEIKQNLIKLSEKNWIIINTREDINIDFENKCFEFNLPGLNERREDIGVLCHYYLRRRHSLHFHLENEFLNSLIAKNYDRNVWQLFEMLDTFVFHVMMRETLDWPTHQVYPEFTHQEHQLYQSLSSVIDEGIKNGKNKEQVIEGLFSDYLLKYTELHGIESLEEEHLDFYEYITKKNAA